MNTRIISACIAKGGVGKSSTALNLGSALSKEGKKVLLIDSDPQVGNMTLALGQSPNTLKYTLANIILHFLDTGEVAGFDETIIPISDNMHLTPANPRLATIQDRLIFERNSGNIFEDNNKVASHDVLKTILSEISDNYDYIIIDCPPSISMLTISALVASNSVIMPVEPHYDCYEALGQIMDIIKRIRSGWNKNLCIEGILITKNQKITTICNEIIDVVNEGYDKKIHIFSENIPLCIKVADSAGAGMNTLDYSPTCEASKAYVALAREVMANG